VQLQATDAERVLLTLVGAGDEPVQRHRQLERERATSILDQFSLSDISRYFPEYPSELARRLS
jgi:hypothetical protein